MEPEINYSIELKERVTHPVPVYAEIMDEPEEEL